MNDWYNANLNDGSINHSNNNNNNNNTVNCDNVNQQMMGFNYPQTVQSQGFIDQNNMSYYKLYFVIFFLFCLCCVLFFAVFLQTVGNKGLHHKTPKIKSVQTKQNNTKQ